MKKTPKFAGLEPLVPSEAFDTFWKFAYKRQEVFWQRMKGTIVEDPVDSIISKYKFTNPYRACDRVSQYLIRHVIYSDDGFSSEDLLLRIILFKLFNKIETWELLEQKFGEVCVEGFDVQAYSRFLDEEMNSGRIIYSNAYMMASGTREFNVTRKHQAHLRLVDMMLNDQLVKKLQEAKDMASAYSLLLAYPLIGKFLAYQYVTDINYSELTNFTESEFTVPGPGARDGIRKCFSSRGGLSETDVIKLMTDRQEYEFERLGLDFRWLGQRKLQYIDIQNVFCETDKYCRIAHPDIKGISGRTKIKQLFVLSEEPIELMFPPKWEIQIEGV